ncbi:WD40/YVTN/BNR-like repeat-containing protein [Acidicapsa acidisoli]|uniref:WD40/YVTN/BNR-like repeat-containing protein n=1 Tax=Acidicapsa acidisoli TaxID=1615681 RepID=UPI0021DFFCA8|nr:transcriptional regulator [Acidicapsa acidisoli]
MKFPSYAFLLLSTLLLSLFSGLTLVVGPARAESHTQPVLWRSIGPYGGDARAFAAVPGEPGHLYLGDTDNWIFETRDGGTTWERLSRVGDVNDPGDLVVDSIVVDAADHATLFAGVWRLGQADGGLFVSHDSGKSWLDVPALKGQSVLSLAQAPSNPDVLVAGSLKGVYRSRDHGATWDLISPPAENPLSREIHEVESLAIDPRKPEVIYAGTWHLPWKTSDDGAHWRNIKQGVIDDSDVFSIILDPERPSVVYASACSGIYKSENGGELFHKIQGIPSTARRTRVLMQDTHHREVVYAGTTEGLYRTRDGGHEWQRLTGADVIVNDIYLDPARPGHILLATDRSGVLASDDGGVTFAQSNQGFSARKVEALVADNRDQRRILAGVVNDKSYGGVFLTTDSGANWSQIATGLDGRDVFTLAQSQDGTVLAGTSHGIFALENGDISGKDSDGPHWVMRSSILNSGTKIVTETVGGRRVNRIENITLPAREMSSRVANFDLSGEVWLVATSEGLFTSKDRGATWQGGLVMGSAEYHSVAVWDGEMLAARRAGLVFSKDQGKNWDPMGIPSKIKDIRKIAFSKDGELWIGAGDGIYFSRDKGANWFWLEKIPIRDVGDLAQDAKTGRMLATSRSNQMLFSIDPKTLQYTATQTGFRLFLARSADGMRFAASLQDGVIAEPVHP